MSEDESAVHRAGTVAIIGRPNVGKSTLLNRMVGCKLSITSRKAQTTRHRITGILTRPDCQYVFVDTPGFQTEHAGAMNRLMNRTVMRSLEAVDAVLFVVQALRFDERDRRVQKMLPAGVPVLLVINKVDLVADKAQLLPFIEARAQEFDYAEIVPVSAELDSGLDELLGALRGRLPEGPPMFGEDEITDASERFLAAEMLREKVFRLLGDELPYSSTVVVDQFTQEGGLRRIAATVYVDRPGHKAIVLGSKGERLKRIATQARLDMERLFGGKVFLTVWVKVRHGWAEDERMLRSMGIGQD